jgi:hypothetical protein
MRRPRVRPRQPGSRGPRGSALRAQRPVREELAGRFRLRERKTQARPGVKRRRHGAPRGAHPVAKGCPRFAEARYRWLRHAALHPPRMRGGQGKTGAPGAATKNTGGGALACSPRRPCSAEAKPLRLREGESQRRRRGCLTTEERCSARATHSVSSPHSGPAFGRPEHRLRRGPIRRVLSIGCGVWVPARGASRLGRDDRHSCPSSRPRRHWRTHATPLPAPDNPRLRFAAKTDSRKMR